VWPDFVEALGGKSLAQYEHIVKISRQASRGTATGFAPDIEPGVSVPWSSATLQRLSVNIEHDGLRLSIVHGGYKLPFPGPDGERP
jgi:hypothetical protein